MRRILIVISLVCMTCSCAPIHIGRGYVIDCSRPKHCVVHH